MSKQVDKYITDIKELPPESTPEEPKPVKKQAAVAVAKQVPQTVVKAEPDKTSKEKKMTEKQSAEQLSPDMAPEELEEEKGFRFPLGVKDIILVVINIVSIILLFVLLFELPKKSEEIKALRLEKFKNEADISYEYGEIQAGKLQAEKIEKIFLDESGVVSFVNEVEKLKNDGGAVKSVAFVNQSSIKDKSGSFGIPVVVSLEGTWEAIDLDLQKIQALPFLLRPVKIEAVRNEEGVIIFQYGGVLYVNDKLRKD